MSGHSGRRHWITVRGTVLVLLAALLLYEIIKVPDATESGLRNIGGGLASMADSFWTFVGKLGSNNG